MNETRRRATNYIRLLQGVSTEIGEWKWERDTCLPVWRFKAYSFSPLFRCLRYWVFRSLIPDEL